MFRYQGGLISVFKIMTRHTACRTFIRESLVTALPSEAVRCTVDIATGNRIKLRNWSTNEYNIHPENNEELDKLQVIMESNTQSWLSIIEGITMGDTIGVSDGSFKAEKGTAAFGLLNRTTGQKYRGCLRCPGPVD